MKEVTIKSKIVGREGSGTGVPSPSSPSASVDLSLYLKKEVWDDAFELKETEDGVPYIFGKLPVLLQYGLTMYADPDNVGVPSLFDGIPIDNSTIYWDETTNADGSVTRVLKAKGVGGEGGSADFGNVLESGTGNAFTSFSISEDGKELTLVKGETFAKQTDLNALSTKLTDFLEGSDTDNIINKWKELEAFLSGMSESSDLADILSGKAEKATTLSGYGITNAYTKTEVTNLLDDYLTLSGGTVTGDLRLRTGSEYTSPYLYFGDSDEVYLKEATDQYLTIHADKGIVLDSPLTTIDGIEIKKSADGVLYIDANLVVSGGITMYGTDGTTSSSIWDGAPIATTKNSANGKGIASFDSNFFAVNNGHVTFIGETGGGASSWDDLEGKPSWIGSTKPTYTFSEIGSKPTTLSGYGITDVYTKNEITSLLTDKASKSTTLSGYGITDAKILNGVITLGANTITPLTQSLGDARYVTALGTSGNDLTWTKNGTTNKITVPFATNSLTADKLSKTWSIWGQSFNGSNDVYGDMTEVGDIYMDGYLRMYSSDYDYMRVVGVNSNNHLVIGYDVWNNERNTYLYGDTIYLYTGSSVSVLDTNGYLYAGTGIGVRSNGSYVRTMLYCDDEEDAVYLQAGNYSGSSRNGTLVFSGISGRDLTLCEVRGDLLATGGITMYSDERKKTILNHVELSLKEVAEAPLIEHYYNSDEKKTTHVGSIAQYWAGLNDWFCKKDGDGFYMMEIQNAALASAISVAREVVRLKNKISELEKKIERLKAA